MAGQHHDVVGQRAAPWRPGCAASRRGRRRAGRCARSSRRRAGRRRTSARRRPAASSYGVRKVTEPSVWPGVWSTTKRSPASSSSWTSASSRTSSGSANSWAPPSSIAVVSARHARHRVGEQVAVARVDPGGGVVGAGDGRHAPHVVDVAVGHQHRDGLEAVLAHDLGDALGGVLAGVDDDALGTRAGGHDVAVRAPRTCGEAGDEHRPTLAIRRSQPRIGLGSEVPLREAL